MSNYKEFDKTIGVISLKQANPVLDWIRDGAQIKINGRTLDEIIRKINPDLCPGEQEARVEFFTNETALKDFFKAHILGTKLDDAKKEAAANYMLKSFHQGGLLSVVGGPMSLFLAEKDLNVSANARKSEILIVTTENGFTVNEDYKCNQVCFFHEEVIKKYGPQLHISLSNPMFEAKDLIHANATLSVDFSTMSLDQGQPEPTILVEGEIVAEINNAVIKEICSGKMQEEASGRVSVQKKAPVSSKQQAADVSAQKYDQVGVQANARVGFFARFGALVAQFYRSLYQGFRGLFQRKTSSKENAGSISPDVTTQDKSTDIPTTLQTQKVQGPRLTIVPTMPSVSVGDLKAPTRPGTPFFTPERTKPLRAETTVPTETYDGETSTAPTSLTSLDGDKDKQLDYQDVSTPGLKQ